MCILPCVFCTIQQNQTILHSEFIIQNSLLVLKRRCRILSVDFDSAVPDC